MSWPTGPECVCFDATVLINYQDNDYLDLLRDLFPGPTFVPNVIPGLELVKTPRAEELNQRLLAATWLEAVPVDDQGGIAAVAALRALWPSSKRGRNHGEAEVIVLCKRHGWIAILDDREGRGAAADGRPMSFVYMSTMLIAAAATGVCGLDADSAWAIHQAVESKRTRPRVQREKDFRALVRIFQTAWEQNGKPDWPLILTDPRLDQLVDLVDPLH